MGADSQEAEQLWQRLADGAGESSDPCARTTLGLAESSDDADLASGLVRRLAAESLDRLALCDLTPDPVQTDQTASPPEVVEVEDASFLGLLEVSGATVEESRLPNVDDAPTLLGVARVVLGEAPVARVAAAVPVLRRSQEQI